MNDIKDTVADAEGMIKNAARSVTQEYAVARKAYARGMDDALSRLDDARVAVKRGARDAADATDGYVRDNPWTALGVAGAVGLVAGLLIRRR